MILVVGYDKERAWKNKFMPGYCSGETDAAIVCTHMLLEAEAQGLGACWVGYFNAQEVARALELPENITAGDSYAKQQTWEVTVTVPATGKVNVLGCTESDPGLELAGDYIPFLCSRSDFS